jgi:hypothetical protein
MFFFLDHAFLVLFIPWTSCPLDESSPVPNHSALRLSLYLPILLSGFFDVLTHSTVRLFAVTCCQVSLHLHTPLAYCPCTFAAPLRLSLNLLILLSGFPAPTHSAVRISLRLRTLMSGVPVPTHSAVRLPSIKPAVRLPLYLPTLLSGFPAFIHVAVRFSLYLPYLLCCHFFSYTYLPSLLLYCICTYPFCYQAVICIFTPLSGFSAPSISDVRRILPKIQTLLYSK